MSQTDKPMHRVSRSVDFTGLRAFEHNWRRWWHDVVLLSQEEEDQVDVKIKKQVRIDFATRTILKAMLSALDKSKTKLSI